MRYWLTRFDFDEDSMPALCTQHVRCVRPGKLVLCRSGDGDHPAAWTTSACQFTSVAYRHPDRSCHAQGTPYADHMRVKAGLSRVNFDPGTAEMNWREARVTFSLRRRPSCRDVNLELPRAWTSGRLEGDHRQNALNRSLYRGSQARHPAQPAATA